RAAADCGEHRPRRSHGRPVRRCARRGDERVLPVGRGLFVTGTDTGIGKTVVSAALMLRYRREFPLMYWKPIQTGSTWDPASAGPSNGPEDDTGEVARLAKCRPSELFQRGVRLPDPVSPHLAARLSGMTIDIAPLLAS